MAINARRSTITFDGGGHSIVEHTTDIITRFRNSLNRNRKERLLDEDVQATGNIVNQLHFTELMAKETLGKLIMQGESMQRSYGLINRLQKQIKDIAEDLNEVNGGKCCGAYSNGAFFGFSCFGCLKKKKSKKTKRRKLYETKPLKTNSTSYDVKINEQNFDPFHRPRWSSTTERGELIARIRALAQERREHPGFIQVINALKDVKRKEKEAKVHKLNKTRYYILQHRASTYAYKDQPDRLINEIDMAINFIELNTHLDHLLQMTEMMTNEVNKHNNVITKIETQAMESGNLLSDYTLLGHHILGTTAVHDGQPMINGEVDASNFRNLAMNHGQRALLHSVL